MGVKTPKKILHTVGGLSSDNLEVVAKAIRDKKDPSGSRKPHFALDASVYAHKYKDKGMEMPAHIVDLAAHLVEEHDSDVSIFCDRTNYRHDSKRDSFRRAADVAKEKARLVKLRLEMMKLHGILKNPSDGIDIRQMKAKLFDVGKQVEGLEKKIRESPLSQLCIQLEEVLNNKTLGGNGGSIILKEALFQADAAIAFEAVNGTVDIIGSTDSDFQILAGRHGVVMTELKFSKEKKRSGDKKRKRKKNGTSLHSIKLACCHWQAMESVLSALHISPNSKKVEKAVHPVLDGQPLDVRALIAVSIGCDANPGGIPGVGPSTIESVVKTISDKGEDVYPALLKWMGTKSKHTERELEVLSETILYEPGNCMDEGEEEELKYLSIPEKVSRYHADFVRNGELIIVDDDDVELCTCKGVKSSSPHNFLRSEGVHTCIDCKADLCRFCNMTDKSNGHVVRCLPCFTGAMSSDGNDNDNMDEAGAQTDKTVEEMRNELLDANVPEARAASIPDVLDLHDEYVVNKRTAICDGIEDNIVMPLHCSNELENLVPIVEFSFIDGGSVLRRDELSDKDRRDILSLLAACVNYSKQVGKTHEKAKGASKSSYAASPDLFVNIAEASRERSGYRLLNRGWRGAMDGDTPSLFDADCFFARSQDGNLCLCIKGQVRASYKDELYDTDVAITEESLYACRCNCKVGCSGNSRHTCIHSFAKLLQIVMAMFDGFGESLLLELAAHLGGDEPDISAEEKDDLRYAIRTLNSCSSTKLQEDSDCGVVELLAKYTVGTERAKLCPRPPSKKEMGPISKLGRVSKPDRYAINLVEEMKKESLLNDADVCNPESKANENGSVNDADAASSEKYPAPFTDGPDWTGTALLRDVISRKVRATASSTMSMAETTGHWAVDYRSDKSGTHALVQKRLKRQLESELSKQFQTLSNREQVKRKSSRSPAPTGEVSNSDTSAEPTPARTGEVPTSDTSAEPTLAADVSTNSSYDEPPKKQQRWSRRCPVPNCDLTNLQCGKGSWHRVPPSESRVPQPGMRSDTLESIARKSFLHAETKRRLGIKSTAVTKGWRVCPKHKYEQVRKSVTVKRFRRRRKKKGASVSVGEHEEVEESVTMEFQVLTDAGHKSIRHKSESDAISRGVGTSRELVKRVSKIKEAKDTDPDISAEFNRYVEEKEKDRVPLSAMSDSVAMEMGIDNGSRFKPSTPTKKMRVLKKDKHPIPAADGSVEINVPVWDRAPTVRLSMPAKEVKRRTGFSDMGMLLGFASVVCNGDVDVLTERVTCLTWLEEWMLYFQFKFGIVSPRLEDIAAYFDCSESIARAVLNDKRRKVLLAREVWPTFFSLEEDKARRSDKWEENYGNKRIIMHDNTSVPAMGSSCADVNRIMFSQYYGGPVAKGGVWIQLGGWLGTIDLWNGAVSDSQYLPDCGIFEEQKAFAEQDTMTVDEVLHFTNVTDKGYRCVVAAWRNGQFLLQPTFHRTDQKFTSKNLLTSATIASDRGANERAVRVCKYSYLIKRGLQRNSDPAVFNEYWLAWSFQANFMYRPVL